VIAGAPDPAGARSAGRLLVGLDVGTSRIVTVVASTSFGDRIDIVGLGAADAAGIRRGFLIDLESATASIRTALAEAELTAGQPIRAVHLGISSAHTAGFNSRGVVSVANGAPIGVDDVLRAVAAATPDAVPDGRVILHVIPRHFVVDDHEEVADPTGMLGVRLEANVHVVTGSASCVRNLGACVARAGASVIDTVVEQLAAGEGALTQDEKDLGIALVNIGGGTTGLTVYEKGAPWRTSAIGIGGDLFTQDIAIGLRSPTREAERLKRRSGCALSSMIEADEMVEVASLGDRPPRVLPRRVLSAILQDRAEDLLRAIARDISDSGCAERLTAGVVLTGGGAMLPGMEELAELVLGLPIRRGVPVGAGGLVDHVSTPACVCAVGLVKYAHRLAASAGRGVVAPERRAAASRRFPSFASLLRR
jgi:cell division protein FtsA